MKAVALFLIAALTTCMDPKTNTELKIDDDGVAYVQNF